MNRFLASTEWGYSGKRVSIVTRIEKRDPFFQEKEKSTGPGGGWVYKISCELDCCQSFPHSAEDVQQIFSPTM